MVKSNYNLRSLERAHVTVYFVIIIVAFLVTVLSITYLSQLFPVKLYS